MGSWLSRCAPLKQRETETAWEQSQDVNIDFTFGEDAKEEEVAKVKDLLGKYTTVFSNN